MGKRIRLNEDQRRWLENLEHFLKHTSYTGDQNLKELMLDGPYAVLHSSEDHPYDQSYDVIVCCENLLTARAVMRYNPGAVFLVVDLESKRLVEQLRKINKGFKFL